VKEKTILKWLEKVFAREIESAFDSEKIIFLIPKKQASILIDLGLIEEHSIQVGIVKYYFHILTHKGRIMYCESCN